MSASGRSSTEFILEEKQLRCLQMPRLAFELQSAQTRLQVLSLRGNQIAWEGLMTILTTFVCVPECRVLRSLDFRDNVVAPVEAADVLEVLEQSIGGPCCPLSTLLLSGNPLAQMAALFVGAGRDLHSLELARCVVGDEGAAAIAKVLSEETAASERSDQWSRRIDLGSNGISDKLAQLLLSA